MVNEEEKLKLLREILLIDDREVARAVDQKLHLISEILDKREKLTEKVEPILDEKLKLFVQDMPETLGPAITATLKVQVEKSKDEIAEALFPILGRMIKRYVQNEMKLLSESINNKFKVFSFNNLKRKIRSKITGINQGELLLSELQDARIDEVFVIQKKSGILLGNYSTTQSIDKEMISGMLTAIKSFAEDAFSKDNQNLESIEYELFTIHIQNFHTFYIAAVVSGLYSQNFENQLEDKLLKFAQSIAKNVKDMNKEVLDAALQNHFYKM